MLDYLQNHRDRTRCGMDPLSELFSLIDMRSAASYRLEAGGQWSLRFPPQSHFKFCTILQGQCWITLNGTSPQRLVTGDTYLLCNSQEYVLANDLNCPIEDGAMLYTKAQTNTVHYGGNETVLVGGEFTFETGNADLFLGTLPQFIHITTQNPAANLLSETLTVLNNELMNENLGRTLMTRRLADILLIHTLRAYVSGIGNDRIGWLAALADVKIGAALKLMHNDVRRSWTLGHLASAVAMSRSSFSSRFRDLVGIPPLEYLTRWRMYLARDALRNDNVSIAMLASNLGYSSESAFRNAFKRVLGYPPRSYWLVSKSEHSSHERP